MDMFRIDHQDVPLLIVVVKLKLGDHLVVFIVYLSFVGLLNVFVGPNALAMQVQHPSVHVTKFMFWGFG